jgi:glycosyltransferase involved in cell wall biosynthesis
MSSSLSIVVPALNEGKNIQSTYGEIKRALDLAHLRDYEIIFIDDFSRDNTFDEMNKVASADSQVRLVRNERNLGLGGSYKKAIGLARKEFFMLVPGDNAWPADGIAEILKQVGQKDIVIPYLAEAGDKGPIRKFLSKGFTTYVNVLFNLRVNYYNGIVVHRLENLRKVSINTDSFAYQAEALVKLLKTGHSYSECGLKTIPRSDGKSKALKIGNLVRVAVTILALRAKYLVYGKKFYKH